MANSVTSGPHDDHRWAFRPRFRRGAFGWRSQPAVARVAEAVSEIKKVRRRDPAVAGEGAVLFLERVAPALEHVDGSSGAIGTAVRRAIEGLVPIIAEAPVADARRRAWLARLYGALEEDASTYLDLLGDFWGDLCATREIASEQADLMLGACRQALAPDRDHRSFFFGTTACLSALFRAGRFAEIVELARGERVFWGYKRWAVRALAAQGRRAEALRLVDASRVPWANDIEIDRLGEEILLASGFTEEAYRRYGLAASRAGTYLATFRAVAKRYPAKAPATILADLVASTPGEEGKWFAAAKEASAQAVERGLVSSA